MSNIQKQHKISPAIAWLTIQKFIIFYCPLDGEHTNQDETDFRTYGNGRNQEREPGMSVRGIKCIQGF